jgi:polysaccharide deacetylase 2 family uncharacterized protein YibQ
VTDERKPVSEEAEIEVPAKADPHFSAALNYWRQMRNVFAILALGALATLGAGMQQWVHAEEAARPPVKIVSLSVSDLPINMTRSPDMLSFGEIAATQTENAQRNLSFLDVKKEAKLVPLDDQLMDEQEKAAPLPQLAMTPSAKVDAKDAKNENTKPAIVLAYNQPLGKPEIIPNLPPRASGRPMIAVVIDDVGLRADTNMQSVNLPGPMTIAFLPYGDNLQLLADIARKNKHEVMVHMPMQGRDTANPGPNALTVDLSAEEIRRRLEWGLTRFTGYTGINNHMGSQFTENILGMEVVIAEMAKRKLVYLDSRTTSKSAARQLAENSQVPYAERDVFLDNHQDGTYVGVQLAEAEVLARRHGSAIAIGHPHPVTLEKILAWSKTLDAKGIDLVPVSKVIAIRQTASWRLAAYRKNGKSPG